MLTQAKNGRAAIRLVGTNTLEHSHAVVQGVREDVDLRLAPSTVLPLCQIRPSRSAIASWLQFLLNIQYHPHARR